MKPFIAAIVAIGVLSVSEVRSQNPPPSGQSSGRMDQALDRLGQELKLTEKQKPQVEAIFHQMQDKVLAAIQQARTNADAQLQNVLTPEQYQKLQGLFEQPPRPTQQHLDHDTNTTGKPPR